MSASEHYQVRRELARGGMGAILEATDQTLDREVAMKVMLEAGEQDPIARQRFLREALVLARLEHPNIVPIHEMGRDAQGRRFYTMKLVKGRTLQAIITAIKKGDTATIQHYTLDRLLTIFCKVCDAVAFAHHHRIIHRDLKPENVMVGEFGEVLVMDWGLAKHLDDEAHSQTEAEAAAKAAPIDGFQELSDEELGGGAGNLTMEGAVMGSPQYMAPEQAEGRISDLGPHSDIYSLGAILYAILTLRHPVTGKNLTEVLSKVASGDIAPPTHYNRVTAEAAKVADGAVTDAKKFTGLPHCPDGQVPESLSAVTMRAMARRAEERYPSVGEIIADIEAYQNGFATSAEIAGLFTQLRLLVRRNKTVASLAAVMLVLTAGFMAKVVSSERRASKNALEARQRLDELKNTAPVFFAQARLDFELGKPELAIEKLGYAIQLNGSVADYHLQRAHYHQSAFRLDDAAADYRRTLELRPDDSSAKTNLALCEKLLQSGAMSDLTQDHKLQVLAALRRQKRGLEANLIAVDVAPELDAGRAAILARLREATKFPGWKNSQTRIQSAADGTFLINYEDLPPIDFSGLKDLPVSGFRFAGASFSNLNCIAGLPLRELRLESCAVTDLSPLRGMPLEVLHMTIGRRRELKRIPLADLSPLRSSKLRELVIPGSSVTNLSPLAGLPLRRLILTSTPVTDLSPLANCRELVALDVTGLAVTDLSPLAKLPLEFLSCMQTPVTNIGPLRNLPLRELFLARTSVMDLTPLANCLTLESLVLPPKPSDLSPLRKLPKLAALSFRDTKLSDGRYTPAQKASEFWREFDARKAQ